jgi:hypothetical protein
MVLLVPLWNEKLSAGIEAIYSSERLTRSGQKTDSIFLLNATLVYPWQTR